MFALSRDAFYLLRFVCFFDKLLFQLLLKGLCYDNERKPICLRHVFVCKKIAHKVMTIKPPTVQLLPIYCIHVGNDKSDILLLHKHSLSFLEVY